MWEGIGSAVMRSPGDWSENDLRSSCLAPLADLPWVHSTWESFRAEDEHHSPLLELLLDVLLLSLKLVLLSEDLLLSTAVSRLLLLLSRVACSCWKSCCGLKDAGCERLRWSTLLNRSWAPLAL